MSAIAAVEVVNLHYEYPDGGIRCAEGIDVTPGEHLLIADEPAAFAGAVVRLLHDRALGDRLAAAGRHHAVSRYDWRSVCPAVERVYDRALQVAGRVRPVLAE